MHASHTNVGEEYDTAMIAVILYIVYQGLMQKLGVTSQLLLTYGADGYLDSTNIAE